MKLKLDKTKEVVTLRLLLVDTPESVEKECRPSTILNRSIKLCRKYFKSLEIQFILNMMKVIKLDKYDRHFRLFMVLLLKMTLIGKCLMKH